ncbi:hypothetical protein [Dysgonomonas sp. ZJ279]|uniref:hypothetical protein n=1 Tax=Dysgonomonas sp. ZJ279 TaxID=2709796 RepID=UPI0013EE2B45|nr:hypothetical protein [Dysgonomonas sp. ZJ279]
MDGYSLTAKMRKIRRRFRLTATEQALYQELISICNEEGWSEIFRVANNELFIALNITEKTLIKARESLINSELIFYKSGKSKRSVGSYSFTKTFETAVKITVDDIGNSIYGG